MAAKKRRQSRETVAAQKAKQQKIILAVGCVILVGLLAFQGPKTLSMLNEKPPKNEAHDRPRPAAGGATAAPATPGAPMAPAVPVPSTGTAAPQTAAVTVAGGVGIADTTSEPTPADGQLISFDRFRTKDPFVQQMPSACTAASSDPAGSATCTSTPTPTPASTPTSTKAGSGSGGAGSTPTTPPTTPTTPTISTPETPSTPPVAVPPPPPTTAMIAVNGTTEPVSVKGTFPASDPTFKVTALTRKGVKIGLVGGSYSSGSPTITLKLGQTLTLMNTADGARYRLQLVSVA